MFMREKIKKRLLYFKKSEVDKRELSAYIKEKSEFVNLSKDELQSKYVNTKVKFEHKKRVMNMLSITLFISVLTVLFTTSKNVINNYVSLLNQVSYQNKEVLYTATLYVYFTLCFIILISAVIWIVNVLSDIKKLQRRLLIIENELE